MKKGQIAILAGITVVAAVVTITAIWLNTDYSKMELDGDWLD
jgi:hypothetical protein